MILVISFLLVGVTMALMAVGLLKGRPLRGSCGRASGACDCANAASCARLKHHPQGSADRPKARRRSSS